jgi:hypothetical protein
MCSAVSGRVQLIWAGERSREQPNLGVNRQREAQSEKNPRRLNVRPLLRCSLSSSMSAHHPALQGQVKAVMHICCPLLVLGSKAAETGKATQNWMLSLLHTWCCYSVASPLPMEDSTFGGWQVLGCLSKNSGFYLQTSRWWYQLRWGSSSSTFCDSM